MWPVTIGDVLEARERIRERLPPTPLRRYAPLDEAVGYGIRVFVKHENHQPTQAFKARNALAALTALSAEEKKRGVVAATRGNHGQGLAWAGQLLGIHVVLCVPRPNNPEKNEAMRGFGAELIEQGDDYDAAAQVAERLVRERGMTLVHSTNHRQVIAGAATERLLREHVCGRARYAHRVRPHLSGAAGRTGRVREGKRSGDRGRLAAAAAHHPQPRGGGGGDGARRPARAARNPRRKERGNLHLRREHRSGDLAPGRLPRNLSGISRRLTRIEGVDMSLLQSVPRPLNTRPRRGFGVV